MATAPANATLPGVPGKKARVVAYSDFIEGHIQKIRAQIKWVDVFSSCVSLAAGLLVALLAAALIDHWIMPLAGWARWAFFLALLGGTAAYLAVRIVPLFVLKVNPVFAAHSIEQQAPSLKNSLVNLLLLRQGPKEQVPEGVLGAVEQQAAAGLANSPADGTVDRSKAIKLGYILVGVMLVCAVYKFVSPKDPLTTVRRIAAPWAGIAAPTRVEIASVIAKPYAPPSSTGSTARSVAQPAGAAESGNISVFTDNFVRVESIVHGLGAKDTVTLHYASLDGRLVDQTITLEPVKDRPDTFSCVVPPSTDGLQQSVEYFVRAGDARSPMFLVKVVPAPAIAVKRVEYSYPAYTKRPPRDDLDMGDLVALEGTQVTIHAEANQEIRQAYIDFQCDGKNDRQMQVAGKTAKITFPLKMKEVPGQGRVPLVDSYQILFTSDAGHDNPKPIRHKIETVADLAPEIKITQPVAPEVELPANAALAIDFEAKDPDFALANVQVLGDLAAAGGNLALKHDLLAKEHTGPFKGTYNLVPAELKLKPGDVLRVWGVARDNRQIDANDKEPNVAQTSRLRIKIVEPKENPQSDQRTPPPNDKPNPQQPNKNPQEQKNPNKQPVAGQRQPQPEGQNNKPPMGSSSKPQPGDKGGPMGQSQANQKPDNKQPMPGDKSQSQPNQGEPDQKNPMQQPMDGAGEKGAGQPQENQPQEQQPVDPNTDPGKAFDKIKQQLEQKQNQGGGESPMGGAQQQPGKGTGTSGGTPENQPRDGSLGNSPTEPAGGESAAGQTGKNEQGGDKTTQPTDPSGKDTPKGGSNLQSEGKGQRDPASDKTPAAGTEQRDSAGATKPTPGASNTKEGHDQPSGKRPNTDNAMGKGAQTKGQGLEDKNKPKDGERDPNKTGGDPDREKGSAGAGDKSEDETGSPTPQERDRPKGDKPDAPDSKGPEADKEHRADSPSGSKEESRSQGSQEGDKAGGGKKGGGQSANQPGTGGAGQNTASDEGASKAPGAGKGETGDNAGDKVKADQPTGQAGNEKGPGSKEQQGAGTQEGGGKTGPAGKGQEQPPPQGKNSSAKPQQGDPGRGGQNLDNSGNTVAPLRNNQGGNTGSDAPIHRQGDDTQGEDPNLDYARKATDVVLDHLKDELNKPEPDAELLKELGWTKEQLAEFVSRWEKVRELAKKEGPAGDKARDQLRNLGLRPPATAVGSNQQSDSVTNLSESLRIPPPAPFADQYKAYQQGRGKGRPPKQP